MLGSRSVLLSMMLALAVLVGKSQEAGSKTCGNCTFIVSDQGMLRREGSCGTDCTGTLKLSNMGIKNMSMRVFEGMSSLSALVLDSNQLTELPPGIFRGLSGLQALELIYNYKLERLHEGSLDGLSNLQYLHFIANHFTEIPPRLLQGMTKLRTIEFSYNYLTSLSNETFAGLSNLWTLALHDNQLTELPSGIFQGLTSMFQLLLSNNRLTHLPAGIFDGLPKLWILDLYKNPLPSTYVLDLRKNLTQVTTFTFSNKEIVLCGSCTFNISRDGLLMRETNCDAGCQILELDHQGLTRIMPGSFDGLFNLRFMNLDHNSLTDLPVGIFSQLSSLWDLNLGYNQLTELPSGVFEGLSNLNSLELYNNQLTQIDAGSFSGLPNLAGLILYYNQLECIPADTFTALTKLQVLWIFANPLTCYFSAWPSFTSTDYGTKQCAADFHCATPTTTPLPSSMTPPPMPIGPAHPWPAPELQSVKACNETRSWSALQSEWYAGRMKTGGLGELLVNDLVEVWACFKNEPCIQALSANNGDWICYVYEEQAERWIVWGLNSDLHLMSD
eukprot:767479-Hanusia_phi.AAC.4